ncbi:pyridoxal phosphate-dependent aminotransferase [Aspergillus aculeatinus CBS 121060]|uniref:PLP-dependent transferase n=1 Tax=Aspergillus aculeatinus CBS 121060 TaxID=1448322 RepID=A0ACD1H1H1_9EURO|nr:PLP-dependent transferase [Aspergillus aculeatinus CBS 121060]RAH67576.1 PLP-dependent transferase [Aspergillus aculeatinus CBS 121060]
MSSPKTSSHFPFSTLSNNCPEQDVWSFVNDAASASPVQPIVNLGQGFFGYNPPQFAIDAAKDALNRVDCNQCSPTKGRPILKQAIARLFSSSWKQPIDAETEVVITSGASEGLLCAFMAFLKPGDEVIVFEPFFDQFISGIELAGGVVRHVPLCPPDQDTNRLKGPSNWTIDFDALKSAINNRTRMMVLNTPHNPTGKVFTQPELQLIGTLCIQHNIIILSDEVYNQLSYAPFTSMANLVPALYSRTLSVGSAGKSLHATGWKIGYLVGPPPLINAVAAIHTKICYSTASPLQEAVAIAYTRAAKTGFWEESRDQMQRKIRCFCEVWDELGIPYTRPEGGYFVLADLSSVQIPDTYSFPPWIATRRRDFHLCWFLIREFGVAAIPPSLFNSEGNARLGENYLRFAVCKEDGLLELAKERLRKLEKYIRAPQEVSAKIFRDVPEGVN